MKSKSILLVSTLILAGIFLLLPSRSASAAENCRPITTFRAKNFVNPTVIDNQFLPLTPGTQLTLEGRANRGGGVLPHKVVFTITDLTKEVKGVPTVVVWDTDTNESQLVESELAFFAQDNSGRVWNAGEYPEEYVAGIFEGAPSTWIAGRQGALAGVHMLADPVVGNPGYLQGSAPTIEFLDCAQVVQAGQTICVPAGCFDNVLVTEEWSPLDPASGRQLKYHAPGIGIIKVEPVNDPEGETLVLVEYRQLTPEELSQARAEALRLDARGLENSNVYSRTEPITTSGLEPGNQPSLEPPVTAGQYTLNEADNTWESDKYIWDPETGQTQGTPKSGYTYNPETGRWDTEKWVYNPESGVYEPREESTQPN